MGQDQLYVRMEDKEEVEEEIDRLEAEMSQVDDLLNLLGSIRSVREKAVERTRGHLEEIDDSLARLSEDMPGEARKEMETSRERDSRPEPQIEGSVDDLHEELQQLQQELQNL